MNQGKWLVVLAFSTSALANTENNTRDDANVSLIENWGKSAISIPKSSYKTADILMQVNQSELQQEFNTKPLAHKQLVDISGGAGNFSVHQLSNTSQDSPMSQLGGEPNEIININRDIQGMNAVYQLGWFSAETGIYQEQSDINQGQNFYLQSNFLLYEKEQFNISLMARFDATQQDGARHSLANPNFYSESFTSQKSLGVITTFSFGNAWTIHGSIKANSFDQDMRYTLTDEDGAQASVGATFSF